MMVKVASKASNFRRQRKLRRAFAFWGALLTTLLMAGTLATAQQQHYWANLAGAPGGGVGAADGRMGFSARFGEDSPRAVAVDSQGNIYVADSGFAAIRKIRPDGEVATLAGAAASGLARGSTDGIGTSASFYQPQSVAVDRSGDVYVADTYNNTIRKITTTGVVSTFAGTPSIDGGYSNGTGSAAQFCWPDGIAVDASGNLYVADELNEVIRKITPSGAVTTLAGSPGVAGFADGKGTAARFAGPWGIDVDSNGDVYVADSANDVVRKITPTGTVPTIAGSPGLTGTADGTGSKARFGGGGLADGPAGLTIASDGNIYVSDYANATIRKVTPAGVVTTLAGMPRSLGSVDGTGSAARFSDPVGIASDNNGNLYVADAFTSQSIRVVNIFTGAVSTLANYEVPVGVGQFNGPEGLVVDTNGNTYIADTDNDTIRKVTPDGVVLPQTE
jgi:sugar lactone lactonase YvrE